MLTLLTRSGSYAGDNKMKAVIRSICSACGAVILAMATLTASGEPGDLFASVNGGFGNGLGSIYQYTPNGERSTFASGLDRPRGLAFDSAGNLFVATTYIDATFRSTILKFTPDGTQSVFGILPAPHFAQDVVIDRYDNVFVMSSHPRFRLSIVFKFTPDGQRTPFATLPKHTGEGVSETFSQGIGLALDSAGNLFAADAVGATIYKFTPDGAWSVFVGPEAFSDLPAGPGGLAFDSSDDLFVSTASFPFTNDMIFRFSSSGVRTTFATGLKMPRGLVFDNAGNLFVAEWPFDVAGSIVKIAADGTLTVFASDIGPPEGSGGPPWLAIQP
jgi:DNA-binding beta-propeller fold protein YncE